MAFDPACEDLAELFIEDPPQRRRLTLAGYSVTEVDGLRHRLAQCIQGAIEDWFSVLDDEIEARERRHGDR